MERKVKSTHEYDAQIARANEANALLSNPILNEVLDKMEADATQKMIDSLDQAQRELQWHKVRAVKDFKQELKMISATGRIAAEKKKTAGDQ
ncbi:hypothetical protein G5S35_22395 [Paraburkholderia tropica]|uniref:hypothetical protein n=1 Tax=Paraburkholderia tropica TaxID=92647 RepID=UPI00160262B7|nr:hypothetical protein [Paraburkholderia tropica]QNB14291.1 hypothetical protein G5S35_22395 [Paraburkholderia tropica]